MPRESSRTRHPAARYLALAIFFSVLCVAFLIVLAVTQIRGSTLPPEEKGTTRSYTVPGVRGEIFDVNGKLLVGNSTSYDLIYEYGAMPDTRREINLSLLAVEDAVMRTGNGDKMATRYPALEGVYPDLSFTKEISNRSSAEYDAYRSFLKRQEWYPDETDAERVVKYFVKRYQLYENLYSNEEITRLILLYYEMERVDFGQYASYTIAEGVNMNLITYLEESNIEGVNFDIHAERVYAYPGIASHILGRLGKITAENADYYMERGYSLDAMVGTSGCEAAFEEWLHGKDGKMVIRYDEHGNQIEKYYEVEPVSGNDVYLTIDVDLQIAAEEALKENIQAIDGAGKGAVTAIDPNTGAILATASYPTYDLTQFGSVSYVESLNENPNNPWLNRALQGVYAPGSTYKIGAALAGLEQGAIDENVTCFCSGTYSEHFSRPKCLGVHGETNVIDAIRDSCNVFFYSLGDAMGLDAMTDYTRRLGLGVPTGVELSEREGTVSDRDGVLSAIGQSDHGYTPLQLSVYMSTIVNGGSRYGAHLLDSVRKFYTGEVVSATEPQVLEEVEFSEETYRILMEGMGAVVTSNPTLKGYFSDIPVTVAGKTGTAEVDGQQANALFSGFAPMEKPEIVVSCIIEEGKAGTRAAYTVGRVMAKYFEIKQGAD